MGEPFPGYECHDEDTLVRHGRNNFIKDYLGEDGHVYVNLHASNGERVAVPKIWLYAVMYGDKPERKPRVDDHETDLDVAHRIERLRACGVPFEQCDRCGEPIPYEAVGFAPLPGRGRCWFRRDNDAELKHEVLCSEILVKEWPLGKKRIPRQFGKPKTKETQ